ncbi:MAG: alpha/beta fold hydrolase, partial [Pseudomonadota bacterium]
MRLVETVIDLPLASGEVLPGARCVAAVWGALNDARDNLVLYPTRFGGTHEQNAFLIGSVRALDPAQFCIVMPNMLGNGVSSSPSHLADGKGGLSFPHVTHADNIALQDALLAEHFAGAEIALAVGWSMGAQQACRWAVTQPHRVKRLAMICGTARTTGHNRVFLESLLAALQADPRYGTDTAPLGGLRAVGRIYAGWAYSQAYVTSALYQEMGFETLDDWLTGYWDALFEARHAGDLTAMLCTWIAHDVADGGDLAQALGQITATTAVATASTDLYFTPRDCAAHATLIPGATYQTLET